MEVEYLEPIDKEGESLLRARFYRSNYAVILPTVVEQLSLIDGAKFANLVLEFAQKFPIAASHRYVTIETEEEAPNEFEPIEGTQTEDNLVFPAALLYSMPQEWQMRFDYICERLTEIWMDNRGYQVDLLHPAAINLDHTIDDCYNCRNRYWETDGEFDPYRGAEINSEAVHNGQK